MGLPEDWSRSKLSLHASALRYIIPLAQAQSMPLPERVALHPPSLAQALEGKHNLVNRSAYAGAVTQVFVRHKPYLVGRLTTALWP